MNLLSNRLSVSFFMLLYIAAFVWNYATWTFPTFGYMGFSFEWKSVLQTTMIVVFCLLPMLWIPLKNRRPTLILYWMLYAMTYIPMIIGVGFAAQFNISQFLWFSSFAVIGFLANGSSYFFPLLAVKGISINKRLFWMICAAIILVLVAIVFIVYRDSLTFVSPFDPSLYNKRAEGGEIGAGTFAGYAIMWLAGAFFPLLFAYGIAYKKWLFILAAVIGFVFVYMTSADKAFLFSMIWISFIYFLCKITKYIGPALMLFFLGVLISLRLLNSSAIFSESLTFFFVSSMILVRLLGASAYAATIYYDFFEDGKAYTYYSHVTGINWFVQYPYHDIIGKEIGATVSSDPNFNANANSYITDGVVAIGAPGMIIAGLICGLVFYLLDSAARKHSFKFSTLALAYNSINLMNISIFTSVISGGLFWIFLFFYFLSAKSKAILNNNILVKSSRRVNKIFQ